MGESKKSAVTWREPVAWYGEELLKLVAEHVDDGMFEGAKVIQEVAKEKAPRASGKLERHIYAASASKHNYKKAGKRNRRIQPPHGAAIVASGAWYGRLLEYGTAKMSAKPFLRPALDEAGTEAIEKIIEYLKSKIDP